MATLPQLENGYTQIANETLEALCHINLSPYESRVLWFIIRKTYGWHKKSDLIPLSQIVEGTGIKKGHSSRSLKALVSRQIVTRIGNKQIGFQKNYEQWLPKQVTSTAEDKKLDREVTSRGTSKKLPAEELKLPAEELKLPKQVTKGYQQRNLKRKKETIQKILIKRKYGEFSNILLSLEEYTKLIERFGEREALGHIENLSSGIASKGYKYKNHYATIISWERRSKEKANGTSRRDTGKDVRKPTTNEERRASIGYKPPYL